MATSKDLKNQLTEQNNQAVDPSKLGLKALMNTPTMKNKFKEVLKEKSDGFMASVLNLVNNDSYLSSVDPMSIVTSAMVAASLDLPVDKNLGYAWIIPYKGKAQFQLGYKGYIQLARRSGQYQSLNVIEVYEGELRGWNRLTEQFEFDPEGRLSDKVIGYVGYFELLNGFKKTVYWTKQEIELHKRKFSKSDFGCKKDFDAMAKKTVLRNMLSKWGILSVEMQKATVTDENVVKDINENGDILSDTNVEEDTPERKEAEKVEDVSSAFDEYEETANTDEQQDSLFDDMNPPL
ncbi:recombinase RecT [Enterococcus hirae]|uniref:recombinase RecT n=1 Tax=Enterococcus hirae TaxID=1354 RepID=UPI000FF88E65|nr:recombinase RecT [Enterococcus hirae]EMF0167533.1 recombinase RecT [Enterococcus hirae]EMF0173815.1 recombinase RecT [Enterococcus hirae]EMF0188466.1 recombinase RecT [Enterococcus hirae]EMF0256624.1 recombinase RecT [Enterococcus hirae]EMF0447573.1 recombinase RecT [Enterococcus hirae]